MSVSKRRLRALFAMVMAGSAMGARGLACGPCLDHVFTVTRLPPDNPDGAPPPAFDPEVVPPEECAKLCGAGYTECDALVSPDGTPLVKCTVPNECGAGRRPRGLRRTAADGTTGVARWLSRAAHLEAASVRAFAALAEEIAALGAPGSLVRRARAAARDEARHARLMGSLARRRGAQIAAVRVRRGAPRSKVALAIENAVEGCVGETFAAFVAHHQSEVARDPRVRRAMRRIAADEAGHAALAHAVERWLLPQLTAAERGRVARAKARAAARLGGWSAGVEVAAELGLPGDREGRVFAAALGRALEWGAQSDGGHE